MKDIISLYKDVIIQIATPYSVGTGFYLKSHKIIVTNEHVVRGNRSVVIKGQTFKKHLTKVIYCDPRFDLAFLEVKEDMEIPNVDLLEDIEKMNEGDRVIAVGHPYSFKYSFTQGIVSNLNQLQPDNDVPYIMHDAALNPGNSGGPLVNEQGNIVGVNTFIVKEGNSVGFALPVNYLVDSINEYKVSHGAVGVRCPSCANLVFEFNIDKHYCPHCGAKIELPSDAEEYEPAGIAKTVEEMLRVIGQDVHLCRKGMNRWQIEEGSAKIDISYYDKSGLIVGDAYLCHLPKENIGALYQYLLKENYKIEGLTFSIKEQDIVLSLLVYDRYLNVETGVKLFQHLFDKADFYDNVLVDKFGAIWRNEV